MSKIVNLFTDDTSINDCKVGCYVKKHFNVVVVENQPVCGLKINVVNRYLNKSFLKNFYLTLFYINYMKSFLKRYPFWNH